MSEEPTKFTQQWWRKQFAGVTFLLNRTAADYESCWNTLTEQRARIEKLESALADSVTEIGRLTDEVDELKEAMEKARAAFHELRKTP